MATSVRAELRDYPDRWKLSVENWAKASDVPTVAAMLHLLESGQTDRHGGVNPTLEVTAKAAEMALHLAATLVHWFSSNHIYRRSDKNSR